ncbi:MAG: hypothetical protein K6T87_19285, partial [Roseiflexus sp.]|uniref:hypothetical protein n=1 Tax=Roseiflexus sp. TaxID=2562120 RepID=UPI0025F12CD0
MSDAKSIQIGAGTRYVRFRRSRIMTGNSGAPSYRRKTFSSLRRPVIPIDVSAPPIAIIIDFIRICFDFWNAFCVSAKFGSYAA